MNLQPLLEAWPHRLWTHEDWAYTESPFENIDPLKIDDVWVNIRFVDPRDLDADPAPSQQHPNQTAGLREATGWRYESRPGVSLPAQFVMEQLQGRTALIGAPGIGKTTFLKWMARQLLMQPDGRFLLPLIVPLRRYALSSHAGGLVAFALQLCGVTDPGQLALWENALAYLSGPRRQTVLFLLDGWDEVPLDRRETLLQEIHLLSQGFTTVITSRPSGYRSPACPEWRLS